MFLWQVLQDQANSVLRFVIIHSAISKEDSGYIWTDIMIAKVAKPESYNIAEVTKSQIVITNEDKYLS